MEPEIDEVYGEAVGDLDRLVASARQIGRQEAATDAQLAVTFTSALLSDPRWDNMMLASVVGAAIVRLARAEAAGR